MAAAISAKRPPNGRLFRRVARKGNGINNPALPAMSQSQSPTELVLSSPEGEGVLEVEQPLQGQPMLVLVDEAPSVDHDLLDQAYNHLQSQGMGTLELAAQDLGECDLIARQICDELGIPCPGYLTEAVRNWVEKAKKEALLLRRASGCYASQLTWERISPPPKVRELVPVSKPEWEPPPRERNRKLLEEGLISLAREERLQELWVVKLKQELKDIDAPVLAKLQGSLDPDRPTC